MHTLRTARGRSLPLGATALADGVNFALLCKHGTAVPLVLLPLDHTTPLADLDLDPRKNRTGDHWHVLVSGLPPAFRYGWRVDGPPGDGHHFDSSVILLDPATTAVSDGTVWGAGTRSYENPTNGTRGTLRRSLFFRRTFDWREDAPPLTPMEDSIIYELHVRGLTAHPSSAVAAPGTFAGLLENIHSVK